MGKKAEKEAELEKQQAKKAEKEAKKAAAAARRDARKEIKKGAEEPEGVEVEELNEGAWSDEEQEKLNQALAKFLNDKTLDTKARWKAIADDVGTRGAKECAVRFKEVKANMMRRQEAAEDARLAAQLAAGEAASSAAAEAYAAAMAKARAELAEADSGEAAYDESKMGALSRADGGKAADKLSDQGVVATFASGTPPHRNAKDIAVTNLSVTFHGAVILESTDLQLNYGNRYGLIGRNGSGKSTLMRVIGSRAVPIADSIDIYHLTTEYPATESTALEAVMSVDAERAAVEVEIDQLNDSMGANADTGETTTEEQQEEIIERLNDLYTRLEELDAATAEARATHILKGLGFSQTRMHMKTKDFSGGWRMRVALARALFIQPSLLLLDEPTNHLDMEAVVWLEDYLSKWKKLLFMVCHSQDFLNNVCSHIVHLDHYRKCLDYYRGNYDTFVETRASAATEQLRRYQAEQEDIKNMKEYVARFGHAGAANARQAKSKQKLLDKKLAGGLTEKPVEDVGLKFRFPDPSYLPPPVLQVNSLTFGYPNQPALYNNVDFGLDLDARIALVGPNGAGKSTLVKVINGELVPRSGAVRPHGHLKMAKFTQHFEDLLDFTKTPLEWFMGLYTDLTRDDARKWLGRYGTSGAVQMQVMSQLSEGQKAKVVFSKMAKENAHLLLLDEPTNALDMEMIDSLADALSNFKGGVLLVSHDMRLISKVAKEIWIVDRGLTRFKGDINDFKMDLRKTMNLDSADDSASSKSKSTASKAAAATKTSAAAGAAAPPKPPPAPQSTGLKLVRPSQPAAIPARASSSSGSSGGGGAAAPAPASSASGSGGSRAGALAPSNSRAAGLAGAFGGSAGGSYQPPHMRNKAAAPPPAPKPVVDNSAW